MKIKMRKRIPQGLFYFVIFLGLLAGCASWKKKKEVPKTYPIQGIEAQWIRDGEPIEYGGKKWCPLDMTENLLDSEVFYLGTYRGVQFFVEKVDVKPYNRLYTKFAKNKFRVFEPQKP